MRKLPILLNYPCAKRYPALGYGALSCALARQCEPEVRRLLSRSHSYILENTRRGESPLHIATPWPKGVEILLDLGGEAIEDILDALNAFDESPLDYALQLGQPRSVQLLVDANAEIDLEETLNMETTATRYTNLPQFDEIINILCQALAARREEMLGFALEWLPDHEISRLRLRDQIMLQDTAFETSEALLDQISYLPRCFGNVKPGSIYHSACLSMNLAQQLLSVGFQNPNTTFHGFTPLMTVDLYDLTHRRFLEGTVDLVSWFLGQGTELHSSIPVSGLEGITAQSTTHLSDFKAVHRIADAYGDGLYRSSITADDRLRIGHMLHVITCNHASADPCICYCSLDGCTPPTLFIRALLANHRWSEFYETPRLAEVLHQGIVLMSIFLSSDWDLPVNVVADVFRVMTFHHLGMKHTCCKYKRQNLEAKIDGVTEAILVGEYKVVKIMDPEEVDEIQEEDRHLAIHLEALVAEFTARYNEQKVSCHDFFFGYWWQRMDEVEAEKDEAWTDDVGSIREIGVILDGER